MPEMMSTETAKAKGRKGGLNKRGKKHRTTIAKEILQIKEIEDLKEVVLENFYQLSKDKDKKLKAFASKEIAKYIFPQKREHSGEINQNVSVTFKY